MLTIKVSPTQLEQHLQQGVTQHLHLACLRIGALEKELQEKTDEAGQLSHEKESLKVGSVYCLITLHQEELSDLRAHPRFKLLLSEMTRGSDGGNVCVSVFRS